MAENKTGAGDRCPPRNDPTMKRLGEITEIRTGYPFRERVERIVNGGCLLVQMGDVRPDSAEVEEDLAHVEAPPNWQKHALRCGDVLFVGRGLRNSAAIFGGKAQDVIAAPHLLILRAEEKTALPDYLAWFLNLRETQERIQAMRRGSAVPFVPVQRLVNLELPLPSIEAQNLIAKIWRLSLQEQRLLLRIRDQRRVLIQGLLHEAVRPKPKH